MRHPHKWWLSTSYSFCIQSFVKKCLMDLKTEAFDGGFLACQEHLKLPIRMFIASSSRFDPSISDLSRPDIDKGEEGEEEEDDDGPSEQLQRSTNCSQAE